MSNDATKAPDPNDPNPFDSHELNRARNILNEIPSHIGRYKILERIGGGGMGEVFVAEQTVPLKRRVALKIIKAGMDTKQVVARFEAERQALAMMDHPNIAKVFDAGTTDTGRPYFVMELVRGVPITEFCDQSKLSTRQRIELLVPVCQAVQHAHQKGIIHRDIKPSNVLVTLHDGKPVPKVIDFGIAKATSQPLTDKTIYTEFRAMIGTPAYMSPEQAEMSGLDVDTRSDIYSLGVLLYELLTGTTPFDTTRLVKAGLLEIQRIIKEEEPPAPSVRLSALVVNCQLPVASKDKNPSSTGNSDLVTLAKSRNLEPQQLVKQIKGELDWIVMKSLEKDRKRRYDTASDLASDLNRYLMGEPVVAAPPSYAYRAKKLIKKHKLALGGVVTLVTMLAIGFLVSNYYRSKANLIAIQEQQRAVVAERQRKIIEDGLNDIFKKGTLVDNYQKADALGMRMGFQAALDTGVIKVAPEDRDVTELAFVSKRLFGKYGEQLQAAEAQRDAAETESYIANLALGQAAMANQNWPEARQRLDKCPESKRGWEWRFLRKQAELVSYGLPAETEGVVFSRDGTRMLALMGIRASILDVATGKQIGERLYVGDVGDIKSATFTNDGKHVTMVYASGDYTVWDALTGMLVSDPVTYASRLPRDSYDWFDVSGDARVAILQCYDHNTAMLWDAVSGKVIGDPMRHENPVTNGQLSVDGKRAITVDYEGAVRLWDATNSKPIGNPIRYAGQTSATFISDGASFVTWSGDNVIQIWDAINAEPHRDAVRFNENIYDVRFSADGKRLMYGTDGGVLHICDAKTGNTIAEPFRVEGLASFTLDGEGVFTTLDDQIGDNQARYQAITLWNINGVQIGKISSIHNRMIGMTWVDQSPDGKRLFMRCDGREFAIDMKDFDSALEWIVPYYNVDLEIPIAMSDNDLSVATQASSTQPTIPSTLTPDGILQILDPKTNKEVKRLGSDDTKVRAFVFSPDNTRLVTADESAIRFYDTSTWRELVVFRQEQAVKELKFTPDGTRLIVQFADGSAQIWDPRPLSERQKMWKKRADERKPAREYVEGLLARLGNGTVRDDATRLSSSKSSASGSGSSSPTTSLSRISATQPSDLKQVIRDDSNITALRKVVALEILDMEIRKMERIRDRESKNPTSRPTTQRSNN